MTSPQPKPTFIEVMQRPLVAGPLGLLVLLLLVFGDLALLPATKILSSARTDVPTLFLYWREWGFGQLRAGHLPLWNPHIAGGYPFFGGFQAALLYPLNWHYLFLPVERAINFDIVLHVYLCGVFFYIWALRRQLHPLACFVAAASVMLGGPFFLHVYPGHLSPLAVMAWAPVVLMATDELLQRPTLRWNLIGALAVTMQVLAGYPQYCFYTAVAVALLTFASLFRHRSTPAAILWKSPASIAVMFVGAALLSMVQLLTGLDAARESVRSSGVSFATASTFSFPPENLFTLLSPNFFGDMSQFPYWGRGYLWEICLFSGVGCTLLALIGLISAQGRQRTWANGCALLALALFILALGSNTPLFRFLYNFVPGFNNFRGNAKFIFFAALFGAMLVAIGIDYLLKAAAVRRRNIIATAVAGVVIAGLASIVSTSAAQGTSGAWGHLLAAIAATQESFHPTGAFYASEFVAAAGSFAASSLWIAAGICVAFTVLLWLQKRSRVPVYLLVALSLSELLWFALTYRPVFDLDEARNIGLHNLRTQFDKSSRYVRFGLDYTADSSGYNLGGYDPYILKRYSEFIAWTQGTNPDTAEAYLTINQNHPLYRMLRLRYGITASKDNVDVRETKDSLPQVLLVPAYRTAQGRDAVFALMKEKNFYPAREVILESQPQIQPGGSSGGSARVVEATSDSLTIEANTAGPQILLITDGYSRNWRAVALPGSSQQEYELLPANYILRAVPLAAGTHRLRIEYAPAAFRWGAWISAVSWLLFIGVALYSWRTRHQRASIHDSSAEQSTPV